MDDYQSAEYQPAKPDSGRLRVRLIKTLLGVESWGIKHKRLLTYATATIGCLASAFCYLVPVEKLFNDEPDILGIWFQQYSFSTPAGTQRIVGTTEYFRNHNYNFVGQMEVRTLFQNRSFDLLYNVDGTGQWEANSESIVIRLDNPKQQLIAAHLDGQVISLRALRAVLKENYQKLEDLLPKGSSDEFKLLAIGGSTLLIETESPQGESIQFEMTRQKHPFSRPVSTSLP